MSSAMMRCLCDPFQTIRLIERVPVQSDSGPPGPRPPAEIEAGASHDRSSQDVR